MEQARKLVEQFDRIDERLNETEPGTPEFDDLLKEWTQIFSKLLENDKAVTEREFKDSELRMKLEEIRKRWYKRPDVMVQLLGCILSLFQFGLLLNHEKNGFITTKLLGLFHKVRVK